LALESQAVEISAGIIYPVSYQPWLVTNPG
jgi:hypothetical protein